jgi:hypothetical protein
MDPGSSRDDIAFVERPVTLYAIFDPQPGRSDLPVPVAEKFSWLAALLPPVFLLRHGLWLQTLAWVLAMAVLFVAGMVLGGGAISCLYLLSAIWLGLSAPSLRCRALEARGWRFRCHRVAAASDHAQLEAIR